MTNCQFLAFPIHHNEFSKISFWLTFSLSLTPSSPLLKYLLKLCSVISFVKDRIKVIVNVEEYLHIIPHSSRSTYILIVLLPPPPLLKNIFQLLTSISFVLRKQLCLMFKNLVNCPIELNELRWNSPTNAIWRH